MIEAIKEKRQRERISKLEKNVNEKIQTIKDFINLRYSADFSDTIIEMVVHQILGPESYNISWSEIAERAEELSDKNTLTTYADNLIDTINKNVDDFKRFVEQHKGKNAFITIESLHKECNYYHIHAKLILSPEFCHPAEYDLQCEPEAMYNPEYNYRLLMFSDDRTYLATHILDLRRRKVRVMSLDELTGAYIPYRIKACEIKDDDGAMLFARNEINNYNSFTSDDKSQQPSTTANIEVHDELTFEEYKKRHNSNDIVSKTIAHDGPTPAVTFDTKEADNEIRRIMREQNEEETFREKSKKKRKK